MIEVGKEEHVLLMVLSLFNKVFLLISNKIKSGKEIILITPTNKMSNMYLSRKD